MNINLAKNNFLISFCNEEIWNHFDSLDSCNPRIIDWKFGHTLLVSSHHRLLSSYICKPKSLSMTKNRQFLNIIPIDIKYLLTIYCFLILKWLLYQCYINTTKTMLWYNDFFFTQKWPHVFARDFSLEVKLCCNSIIYM